MIKYSYYYKDHLGSITAVMDGASGTITQAQDYDAWGDICRTYSTTDTTVNKFTGKERDTETGYDYFGARYYDSRISVWLSPDPLFEKHLQWSPYNYVLRNPFVLIDPDGRQIDVIGGTKEEREEFLETLGIEGLTFEAKGSNKVVYNGGNKDKNETVKFILDLIQGKITSYKDNPNGAPVILNCEIKENSYFWENGEIIFFPAEGYGGNLYDKTDNKVIGRQYFHLPSINKMDAYNIYDEQDLLRHAITEGGKGAQYRLIYDDAHKIASELKMGPLFDRVERIATLKKYMLRYYYRKNNDGNKYETIFDYENIKEK